MNLSVSFLSIKENLKSNIELLDRNNIDYLHLDIMDGIFVLNKTWKFEEMKDLLENTSKPLDVHLMVKDVMTYIKEYEQLKPEFITFHLEAVNDVKEIIDYIKSKNIKVGLSIKPNTIVNEIIEFLPFIDLVLVMSVEPGFGGQEFIENTFTKIKELDLFRIQNNYNYLIEVDGGINDTNIKQLKELNTDIIVVGSYVTNNNYKETIDRLKNN